MSIRSAIDKVLGKYERFARVIKDPNAGEDETYFAFSSMFGGEREFWVEVAANYHRRNANQAAKEKADVVLSLAAPKPVETEKAEPAAAPVPKQAPAQVITPKPKAAKPAAQPKPATVPARTLDNNKEGEERKNKLINFLKKFVEGEWIKIAETRQLLTRVVESGVTLTEAEIKAVFDADKKARGLEKPTYLIDDNTRDLLYMAPAELVGEFAFNGQKGELTKVLAELNGLNGEQVPRSLVARIYLVGYAIDALIRKRGLDEFEKGRVETLQAATGKAGLEKVADQLGELTKDSRLALEAVHKAARVPNNLLGEKFAELGLVQLPDAEADERQNKRASDSAKVASNFAAATASI
jgi:hypothetical protein